MLVWTQPIYGIQEQSQKRAVLFSLPELDRRAWVVFGFLPVSFVTLFLLFHFSPLARANFLNIAAFLIILIFSKHLMVQIPTKTRSTFDAEPVVVLGSLLVIGPFWTVANALVGVIWYSFFLSKKIKIWTHISNLELVLITDGISALIYGLLYIFNPFVALVSAGMVLSLLNLTLPTIYLAFVFRQRVQDVWRENGFTFNLAFSLVYIPVGYLLGALYLSYPPFIALFIPPFLLLHFASKSFFNIRQEMGIALQAFGDLLAQRDEYTYEHTLRVAEYARTIGVEMGLKQDVIDMCVRVARMHDIGKIAVQDSVLHKEGALTNEEFQHVKEHVRLIPELFPHMDRFGEILHLVMYHHEKFDGTGYPFGLKGEDIPIVARVVSVADAWDAMTTTRVYRKGMPVEQALKILDEHTGKQWDPAVVSAFMRAYKKGLCRPPAD